MPQIVGSGRGRGIALVALCALGQAAGAAGAAYATRDLFVALRQEAGPEVVLPIVALTVIVASGFLIGGARLAERVVAERVGQSYAADLRQMLFSHLTRVSAREIDGRRSGGLALRFVGDLAAVRGWVSLGLARIISAAIVLPLATLVLFLLDPRLGMAAIGPIAAGFAITTVVGIRMAPVYHRLRQRRGKLAADMSERIPVAPHLRLLGRMDVETRHLTKRTAQLVDAAVGRAFFAATLRAIPDVVSGFAGAAIVFVALRAGIGAPEVAGALAAVGLMIQPLRSLAGVWDQHRNWIAARDKCEKLLSLPRHARSAAGKSKATDAPATLSLKNVTAGVLIDIDVDVAPGRKIAIVGANGAGKSSLLALVAGLEVPRVGSVLLSGKSPETLNVRERLRAVALMTKASPILAGSLRRALTMGAAGSITDSKVEARARAFGLGELLDRVGGLDGRIAESGRNLSAGEVRRVLLTRLSLSRAKLLLIDEPENALDGEAGELVERIVRNNAATVLMVTHNLALARAMDEVWLLAGGRVAERGAPEQVLRAGGPALRLFQPKLAA